MPFLPSSKTRPGSIVAQRQATLSLNFLVIGAGIGGLSCAYSLASSGHRVKILEAVSQNARKSYSGLRVPPNMSKILTEWGLGEELKAKTRPCRQAAFDDLRTNENIGAILWRDEIIAETGGDFLLMHHADLHEMLLRIALEAGVEIRYGARVAQVIPGEELPQDDIPYRLVNGEIFTADVIIGADGSRSIVREILLKPGQDHGVESGYTIYSTDVDTETMDKDPLLKQLVDDQDWHIWMDDRRSLLSYPVGRDGKYAVHCFCHDDIHTKKTSPLPCDKPSWETEWSKDKLLSLYSDCNAVRLLEIIDSPIILARYLVLPKCETWVHESYTIALLGEAAHPNLPCSNQSIGMCMEDAAVFGGLFSRLRSWDQVPSLMEAYQDLRQERTHFVACQDQANADITWCPPGPHRDARDAAMQTDKQCGLDEFSEGMLRDQWDTVSEVFAYCASDAAADWWVCWGMLAEMAKRRAGDFLQIEMTVVPQVISV
ncbi:FAD/NAD(P)-binding domain-containing protein [Thelephora ganbajun]|uniref:FAD/NAD(P)-binding domain-containing protein n=1 Tax=Thelephora ganbajun TaxID=370292 RepID=A0ACB6Z631_THEGA|nr:FAD/NAD(P)-binding domain-containing protein [Thelephora ganbajun]